MLSVSLNEINFFLPVKLYTPKRDISLTAYQRKDRKKEGNVLFNGTSNTFYFRFIWFQTQSMTFVKLVVEHWLE